MAARPDFKAAFGEHPVPQLLDDLAEFAADVKGYYSGRFKLAPGDATEWLGGPAKKADFAVFGHEPDGSLYAFWCLEGRTPANAPIVFLDADRAVSGVLASTLEDFLALLTLDVPELGRFYDDVDWPHKHNANNAAYKKWLLECFGIEALPPKQAPRLVKKAATGYPSPDVRYKRGTKPLEA